MALTGAEQVVINTLERLVSNDTNRLQAFRTRDTAEGFRNLLNVGQGTDDLDAGGLYEPTTTTTTPLTSDIEAGLLVAPQVGSLNVLISAGLAWCVTPQTTSDNSVYEYVNDAGVQTLGALVMTGNSSGQTRVDVIECQPQDVVTETDSRDIFNPVTGLFNAVTVTKATAAQMVYRVRAGTPGSGFPGTVSGWLPLCVASVPSPSTTCDQMTFWDVRPLLNDHAGSATYSKPWRRNSNVNGATATAVSGIADYVEPTLGRRLGGNLRTGTTIADAATVDITNAANQDPTIAGIASGNPFFVWLLAPFGLPRWARYTDSGSGSRIPRSPRGILSVSLNGPRSDGVISSLARPQLPASTGLGSTSITAGVCVGAGFYIGASFKMASEADGTSFLQTSPSLTMTPSGTSATVALAGLFPADATELYVFVSANVTPAGGGSTTLWNSLSALGVQAAPLAGVIGLFDVAAGDTYDIPLDLPQGATVTQFTSNALCLLSPTGNSTLAIYKVKYVGGVRTQTQIGSTAPGPVGTSASYQPINVAATEVIDNTQWAYYAQIIGDGSVETGWTQVEVTLNLAAGGTCVVSMGGTGTDQGGGGYYSADGGAQSVSFYTWVSLVPQVPAGALPSTTLTLTTAGTGGATINSANCAVLGWRRMR